MHHRITDVGDDECQQHGRKELTKIEKEPQAAGYGEEPG